MRLETEFRLYLQRQSLEWALQHWPMESAPTAIAATTPTDVNPVIAPSTWVRLVHSPSTYSSDEALLLCQCTDKQWLAWVPDYGEIVLDQEQFYPLS